MAESEVKLRLAAVLAADVAGYSRLMADDETATIKALDQARAVFRGQIVDHGGRVVDTAGDSVLAVFETAGGAVEAARMVQAALTDLNAEVADDRKMLFRIGVHLGDIHVKADGTIYGDGVNVAARLEGLAEPGGLTVSDPVQGTLRGRTEARFDFAGEHQVKNIPEPVRVYRVVDADAKTASVRAFPASVLAAAAAVVLISLGVVIWAVIEHAGAPPTLEAVVPEDPVLALPTGPRIAVLPFDNLSGDPDQDYFADGITEQLITELARFRELFVLARNTTFQYKGQAVDVKRIGRELGVNYVVEGSVRRAADTIRVTAQLLDAKSGAHLWAETYDRDLTAGNIFEVQDDITTQVVAMIASGYGGVITRVGLRNAEARAPESLYAYQCVLRAYEYLGIRTPEEHARLRACLERAVEEEPTYADAWAWLAWVYLDEFQAGFNARPGYQPLQRALEVARQAVELEPTNYVGHWLLAKVYFFLHDIDSFYAEGDRALALNPNNATMVGDLGVGVTMSGDWERGVALVRKATTLNPHYPGEYNFAFGKNHFRKREYDQALAAFQKINMPGYFANHLVLAYTYGQLGRLEEAHDAVDRLRELWPGYSIADAIEYNEIWNIEQSYTDLAIEGLRKAGLDIPDEPAAAD